MFIRLNGSGEGSSCSLASLGPVSVFVSSDFKTQSWSGSLPIHPGLELWDGPCPGVVIFQGACGKGIGGLWGSSWGPRSGRDSMWYPTSSASDPPGPCESWDPHGLLLKSSGFRPSWFCNQPHRLPLPSGYFFNYVIKLYSTHPAGSHLPVSLQTEEEAGLP